MAHDRRCKLYYPRLEFCTDNGAMIAYAGCRRLEAGETSPLALDIRARWSLEDLEVVHD
jgi:N6-L-threonylcarbamoyladenine synthase